LHLSPDTLREFARNGSPINTVARSEERAWAGAAVIVAVLSSLWIAAVL
jgi:hypothetical protein